MIISIHETQIFFLALTRTLALLGGIPVLGSAVIPTRVRLGVGIMLALVLVPMQPIAAPSTAIPLGPFLLQVGLELTTGLLAGFVIRAAFAALQMAAGMMSLLAGFSAGQFINPTLNIQGSALDQFFLLTTTTIFVVLNGHHQLIIGLSRIFDLVPLGTFVFDVVARDQLVAITVGMWTSALQIAFPLVAAMFLVDLALGLIARAAPQIQVFFLGAPLKTGLGMLALAASLPILLPIVQSLFDRSAVHMIELLQ